MPASATCPRCPCGPLCGGPGEALYGAPTRSILARLVGAPFFGATIEDVASGVRELPIGTTEVAWLEVSTRAQRLHTHPTLALRMGGPDEELARVARADFPAASVGRDMEEVRVLRAARVPGRLPHPALGAGVEGPDSD